jgi:hypothetical protein
MKKIIIITLLIVSQNIYAHIDSNIMEIYESNKENIPRDGFIQRDKQNKLIQRYQMEVKELKKEAEERRQKQLSEDNSNEQIYQNMIQRLGNDLTSSSL